MFILGGIGAEGGPPPWIPFGQRLEALTLDKQFKSLQDGAKQDNAEFEAQRKGAIAEAQRLSGVKKVIWGFHGLIFPTQTVLFIYMYIF